MPALVSVLLSLLSAPATLDASTCLARARRILNGQ